MRKLTYVAVALLFTAAVASAAPHKAATKPMTKTHMVAAEVVSTDAAAKKLTVKDEKGTEMSLPVQGKAISELASVKVGEKVELKCLDNDKGEHEAIVGIKAAKAPAMTKAPKK